MFTFTELKLVLEGRVNASDWDLDGSSAIGGWVQLVPVSQLRPVNLSMAWWLWR